MVDHNPGSPLLFVNVDGVLTSARTYWMKQPNTGAMQSRVIDRAALSIFAKFCTKTKARVVMASAWSHFIFKSAEEWTAFFAELGCAIPVVDMLPMPEDDCTWADEMDAYMTAHPDTPHILFEDDPSVKDHPHVIDVDAQVGLSTVNLQEAAERLNPDSELALELGRLNKSFSPEQTIGISFGGKAVEVHPRDFGKGLDVLGVGTPAATE